MDEDDIIREPLLREALKGHPVHLSVHFGIAIPAAHVFITTPTGPLFACVVAPDVDETFYSHPAPTRERADIIAAFAAWIDRNFPDAVGAPVVIDQIVPDDQESSK